MPAKSKSKGNGAKAQGPAAIPKATLPSAGSQPSDASQTKVATATPDGASSVNQAPEAAPAETTHDDSTAVNRKKQKRRLKEAAKKAAEQNDSVTLQQPQGRAESFDYSDFEDAEEFEPGEVDDVYYTDNVINPQYSSIFQSLRPPNSHSVSQPDGVNGRASKAKRKAKKKGAEGTIPEPSVPSHIPYPPHFHTPQPRDRIWNTSTAEERERIKQFWLALGEDDRRSLVKVEKEAVLKKMKEQQKHSCSCTVCGRKRTAIEEELEVLYDAYYEELEHYANVNQQQLNLDASSPADLISHTKPYHQTSNSHAQGYESALSSATRIREVGDEEDLGDDEEDSEDFEEDRFSLDHLEPERERTAAAADFFNFGNSLTVQGGILTVADDLLKNDGKKFIEMMEQLAERRMQREEDAQFPNSTIQAQGISPQHYHPNTAPLEDTMYDEVEEEDEYDSGADDYENDSMDAMNEDERMEEGRRMFQIFAARMFEQRVLTAYREKVALERQQRLIEELDDESRVDAQREAKKAKENAKKKEKKKQQKQARDEEKAKRDAEKAAEEAAAKALEDQKAEEQRQKKEEQRKKREAEKKSQEEERLRKEAEKQRRVQEAKDLQAEQERKQREAKEREKKRREDAKKKEREEQLAKEKEQRDAEEKKRQAAKAATAQAQAARAQHKADIKESVTAKPAPAKKASTVPAPVAALNTASVASSIQNSPHLPITTPVIPKAPTPVKPRQSSTQDMRMTSPRVPIASPNLSAGSQMNSPSSAHPGIKRTTPPQQGPYSSKTSTASANIRPPGFAPRQAPALSSAFDPSASGPFSPESNSSFAVPPLQQHQNIPAPRGQHFSTFQQTPTLPAFSPISTAPAAFSSTRNKAENVPHPNTAGRGQGSYGEFGHSSLTGTNVPPSKPHSRNTSTSSNVAAHNQVFGRPAPIQPPSSNMSQQPNEMKDADDLANHLGSKALLDDDDEEDLAITSPVTGNSHRHGYGPSPPGFQPIGTQVYDQHGRSIAPGSNPSWHGQQSPFAGSNNSPWESSASFGRPNTQSGFVAPISNPNAFGASNSQTLVQRAATRPATVRTLASQACQSVASQRTPGTFEAAWQAVDEILQEIQRQKPAALTPVGYSELLEACEKQDPPLSGRGRFELFNDKGVMLIRYHPPRNLIANTASYNEVISQLSGSSSLFGSSRASFLPPGAFPPANGF